MKVAVTGIGIVCGAGVGLPAVLERLAAGPLVPQEPSTLRGKQATPKVLPIPDFKARDWLTRRKDLKLMSRPHQLAVAAAVLAVRHAGLADADLTDAGMYLGVGMEPGGLDDLLPGLVVCMPDGVVTAQTLVNDGMPRINPLVSLKTLPNLGLAHAAINLGCMGPSQALCAGPDSGPRAIREGAQAIVDGLAPVVLAGASDSWVNFIELVAATRLKKGDVTGEGAVWFVLEPAAAATARGARIWGYVEPNDGGEDVADALGYCGTSSTALNMAVALGQGRAVSSGPVSLRPQTRAPAFIRTGADDTIVVSAMGIRTPLGNDFATFRDRLLAGDSATGPITHFDATDFPVQNVCQANFDPAELPAALAEAIHGLEDRKAELGLAAAIAAVQAHGALDPRAGVVYATGLSSASLTELNQDIGPYLRGHEFDYAAFHRGSPAPRAQGPLRHLVDRPVELLRDHLKLSGPTACHFSACAAGAAAIAHAADLIRRGDAPMMLVGGADSMIHPYGLVPFMLLGATTTEADPAIAGRPFDKDRSGFVMGEGGAFFVLERAADARAAGRRIYGSILGAGTSVDAYNVTAPHPQGAGAVRAMRAAIQSAGLARVDYINAHGTGTALNDVIEADAVHQLFGDDAPPVSSSKGQFGHIIAAAGAIELIACLAAFDGERLPPNPRMGTPDPAIQVPLVPPSGQAGAPRTILSNSFGFGGQNACLVLGHPDDLGRKNA